MTPRMASRNGLSRSGLYRAANSGSLDRIARGIYRDSKSQPANNDWIEAAIRRPDSTICLISALEYYDLTDAIPDALNMAIPRGSRRPVTESAIRWHLFSRDTFDLGRSEIPIPGSDMRIGIYSQERTITDLFRLRGDYGYELGRDALREWLRRGGKPASLIAISSRVPRAHTPLMQALEFLT